MTHTAPSAATRLAGLALMALLAGAAHAQYKVVGPDGKVTYTDRPPTDQSAKVSPLRTEGSSAQTGLALAGLPLELRQVAQRFPVVLYTTTDCAPCDSARSMLAQRGIPLVERTVTSQEDLQALERTTGVRSLPAMTVGAQATGGYAPAIWSGLLDLAGYPAQSRLPADWRNPAATPLTQAPPAPAPAPAPAAEREVRPAPPPPPPPASGIRF